MNIYLFIFYGAKIYVSTCLQQDLVAGQLVNITDKLYFCKWYLFPIKVQKSLPIMIRAAANPIFMFGFGTTSCIRTTFQAVILHFILSFEQYFQSDMLFHITNAGFSYFTMLRQVND